jgi:hypothetical protein
MSYIAQSMPRGMNMGEGWDHAENLMIQSAIFSGAYLRDPGVLDHIHEFVFQQQQAGTYKSLQNAYTAWQMGDVNSAAQYLAKAHAFAPDGAAAIFTPRADGTIWSQRFDENTHKPIGQPFQVTKEGLLPALARVANPTTFAASINAERDTNEKVAHDQNEEALTARGQEITRQTEQAKLIYQGQLEAARQAAENERARFAHESAVSVGQARIDAADNRATMTANKTGMPKATPELVADMAQQFGDSIPDYMGPNQPAKSPFLNADANKTPFSAQQNDAVQQYYQALKQSDPSLASDVAKRQALGLTTLSGKDAQGNPDTSYHFRAEVNPQTGRMEMRVYDDKGVGRSYLPPSFLAGLGNHAVDDILNRYPQTRGQLPRVMVQPPRPLAPFNAPAPPALGTLPPIQPLTQQPLRG